MGNALERAYSEHQSLTQTLETGSEVFTDFVSGIYEEAKNNPGKLCQEASIGAAVGAVTLCLLSPELSMAAAVAGTVYGAYQLGKSVVNLADDARVINDANSSPISLEEAHDSIKQMGAASLDAAALGLGAGLATRYALGGAKFYLKNPTPLGQPLFPYLADSLRADLSGAYEAVNSFRPSRIIPDSIRVFGQVDAVESIFDSLDPPKLSSCPVQKSNLGKTNMQEYPSYSCIEKRY